MLYVCATPIGNLDDVSLRLLSTLRSVSVVACEDTRRTLKLLSHFNIKGPRLVSLHEHNEPEAVSVLMPLLRAGADVALVSDAGMPLLSDPGLKLVQACQAEGIPVKVVPGPSAVTAALSVCGLPSDRVLFVGFLPRTPAAIKDLIGEVARLGATVVAFESPRRLRKSLEVLQSFVPEADVVVCRELTKVFEEVRRGKPGELLMDLPDPLRGEVVVVFRLQQPTGKDRDLLRKEAPALSEDEIAAIVQRRLQEGFSVRNVAKRVAELTGLSSNEAYARVLALRDGGGVRPSQKTRENEEQTPL